MKKMTMALLVLLSATFSLAASADRIRIFVSNKADYPIKLGCFWIEMHGKKVPAHADDLQIFSKASGKMHYGYYHKNITCNLTKMTTPKTNVSFELNPRPTSKAHNIHIVFAPTNTGNEIFQYNTGPADSE